MPIHLQELDKEMHLTRHRHKTPEVFLGIQVSAAGSCQHTPQGTAGPRGCRMLWNCAIVFCCTVEPSELLWLQLHKQIPSSDTEDHALTLVKNLLLFATFFVCPLYSGETKEISCTELPSSSGNKTLSGTWNFSVTASQGGTTPIMPGGKNKKAFFWLLPEVMFETAIISALYFSVLLLIDFQGGSFFPPFLALLKNTQIGFTRFWVFSLCALSSFLFGNLAYLFRSPRGSPEFPHHWCQLSALCPELFWQNKKCW